MSTKTSYDSNAFGFNEQQSQLLWNNIVLILDQNIKVETEMAIRQDIEPEKRTHQCGRVNSLVEIKEMLIAERKKALEFANIDWSKDETLI